jgi:glyoxylase-like metal-dependent hydrolase (beta-lactamase superfamily II)
MTEQEEISMSHNAHETTRADDDGCRCHMIDDPALDTSPSSTAGVSRGAFLRRSAVGLALPAGLALAGQPVARALAGSDAEAATYDPVPATAKGPAIPSKGYLVQQIGAGLYFLTDGLYQMMFLTTGQGVIAVDAPPTIGHNILRAIAEVTTEPVTHVVYSHVHADHIGAAVLYPHDAVRIANTETARLLRRVNDPNRPLPTRTFQDHYTLRVGDQVLQLDYRGPNHSPDNIFIHAPRQKVLMLIDIVFPGWVPFRNLAASQDVPGWIAAHEQALTYDFQTLIGGHLTRLGTRQDVSTQREYVKDLTTNAQEALLGVDFGAIYQAVGPRNPGNSWALFKAYLDAVSQRAAAATQRTWRGRLGAVDVFTYDSAYTMAESLRIDYGVLGPFGIAK